MFIQNQLDANSALGYKSNQLLYPSRQACWLQSEPQFPGSRVSRAILLGQDESREQGFMNSGCSADHEDLRRQSGKLNSDFWKSSSPETLYLLAALALIPYVPAAISSRNPRPVAT
jgi:hypothetical protein